MTARYRFDPGQSRFTVQAFATGMLSLFAHSPTFAVRTLSGTIVFEEGKVSGLRAELTIPADSLELVDRVKPADREEIETRMRREVLEIASYPQIAYQSAAVQYEALAPGRYRLRVDGRLSLHGITNAHPLDADLVVFEDGLRVRGASALRLSAYRIRPVTAVGGTIKLRDELKLAFDLAALPGERGA